MSALADYRLQAGGCVSGSDRYFDRGEERAERARLVRRGATIHPQDGSGVEGAYCVVASTAVEAAIPDLEAARCLGVPILRRAQWLALEVERRRTIAVGGTSGKSTVVAMIYEMLEELGHRPGLITGGDLIRLRRGDFRGNASFGDTKDPLVIEADESDRSLTAYRPAIGVVLNLHRDHEEPEALIPVFETFKQRCTEGFVTGDGPLLRSLRSDALVVGESERAHFRGKILDDDERGARLEVEGFAVQLGFPGRHNAENALAALGVARALGIDTAEAAKALSQCRGVRRRFQILGRPRGIEVIDDFAHNPTKVEAALRTAKSRARRLHAVFQPHGFTQTARLLQDYVDVFADVLDSTDTLHILDIYYAGGTVKRVISTDDVVEALREKGVNAFRAPDRAELGDRIANEAREGDAILLMGARDPSLG
ncbi:MAG TPA: UDP-N-acetylmuramate--alanine ligase, partial [Planctomycetes bacterium]|nr:UDP-N-acetylmuramate--alanine ligase [Planctomycetota bacterium]